MAEVVFPAPDVSMHGKGRSALTPELYLRLYGTVSMGNYVDVACAAAGISQPTYMAWMKRGRQLMEWLEGQGIEAAQVYDRFNKDVGRNLEEPPDGWHNNDWKAVVFLVGMTRATAEAEAYAVGIVRKAMPMQWQAAMTYLERKHNKRWRKRDMHEHIEVTADETEDKMLEDEGAVEAMHEAVRRASNAGELAPPPTVADAEEVD